MVVIASVRFTVSTSLKCARTSSYTSSGAWPSWIFVSASVHASAARSRCVYASDLRHSTTSAMRVSGSCSFLNAAVCSWMQYSHPFIREASSRTRSSSTGSRPVPVLR